MELTLQYVCVWWRWGAEGPREPGGEMARLGLKITAEEWQEGEVKVAGSNHGDSGLKEGGDTFQYPQYPEHFTCIIHTVLA